MDRSTKEETCCCVAEGVDLAVAVVVVTAVVLIAPLVSFNTTCFNYSEPEDLRPFIAAPLSRALPIAKRSMKQTTPGPNPTPDTVGHFPTGGHRLFVKGDYWTTSNSGEVTFHTPRSPASEAERPFTTTGPAIRPSLLLSYPIDITPTKTEPPDSEHWDRRLQGFQGTSRTRPAEPNFATVSVHWIRGPQPQLGDSLSRQH